MSRAITVWLDDEALSALAVLERSGFGESEAVRRALIEVAGGIGPKTLDADELEAALDKSHDRLSEVLTTLRPPR